MALALGDVVVGWREGATSRLRQYDSGGSSLNVVDWDLGSIPQRLAIHGDTSIYVAVSTGAVQGIARYDADLTKVWERIYYHTTPGRINDSDPNFKPQGISVGGSPSALGSDDVVYVASFGAPYQIRKYSAANVLLDTFEDLTGAFYSMHVDETQQIAYLVDGTTTEVFRYDLQARAMMSSVLTAPAPYDWLLDVKQKPDGRFLTSSWDNDDLINPRDTAVDIDSGATIFQTYSDNGRCEGVGYDGEDALWMHRSTSFKKWNVTSGALEIDVTPPASMASNGAIGVVYRYPSGGGGETTDANARAWGHVIG